MGKGNQLVENEQSKYRYTEHWKGMNKNEYKKEL